MEGKEIVTVEESALGRIVITEAQVSLIKNTVAIGASDDELKLFFYECRRRGVHPLDRMIHFVKRGKDDRARATFQAGIDFLRSQAEETGEYRGQEKPEFGPLKKETAYPEWATVTVRRKDPESGEVYPVSATAYWDEYYPGEQLGFMWRKMPRSQLAKCAEALALRKAFPKKIQGLYSFEEMEQADMMETNGKPTIQEPKKKEPTLPTTDTLSVVTNILNVLQKDGKKSDGKPWTLYTLICKGDKGDLRFSTFSHTVGKAALEAKGTPALFEIHYKDKGAQYPGEIVDDGLIPIGPPEDADAQ